MRYFEILNETSVTPEQSYRYIEFIFRWFDGDFMSRDGDASDSSMWLEIAKIFPPQINKSRVELFRLITLPIEYADMHEVTVKPAIGTISSWMGHEESVDAVGEIADEFFHSGMNPENTCRITISAKIPKENILATPESVVNILKTLLPKISHLSGIDFNRIRKFIEDCEKPGGYFGQDEFIVLTPAKVTSPVHYIYRRGHESASDLGYGYG